MTTVQLDSQKIEQLLNAATSERQRKMYQALLDKARKQERSSTKNKQPQTIPSTEKTAQTTTKSSTKTQNKTKTVKKNQKVATQSTTTEASTTTKQSPKTVTESSPIPSATVTSEPTTTEQAPQTEPKSQSKKKKKKQPAVKAPIFQAVGTVIATPYFQDERSYLKINGSEYKLLHAQGFRRQAYTRLKEELEKNGSREMFLRLYPKVTYDYKTQQAKLSFLLVNFSRDCEKINDEPIGFVLRGIWQYIPHSKTPVITIYRNHQHKAYFKNLSKQQQLAFARPIHLPVVWDAPVEPFKYNPEAEKEAQMPRYFVEVRAIFKDDLFVVEEMLSEPTRKTPKFIKISKSSN